MKLNTDRVMRIPLLMLFPENRAVPFFMEFPFRMLAYGRKLKNLQKKTNTFSQRAVRPLNNQGDHIYGVKVCYYTKGGSLYRTMQP